MMKINSKVRYGLRAMIEIAVNDNNKGILQKDISLNQKISGKYLDQIIAALKSSDLITNASGKKSGYVLTKPINKIRIYDIYKSFESELYIIQCIKKSSVCVGCNSAICGASNNYWGQLNNMIVEFLKKTTLEDIVKEHVKIKLNKFSGKK